MKRNLCIIDGYNFIHKNRGLSIFLDKSLKNARDALLLYLHKFSSLKKTYSSYWVVFDSKVSLPHISVNYKNIRLFFSDSYESADEMIVDMIRNFRGDYRLTVVSDDNYIRNHCRVYGITSVSVHQFTDILVPRKEPNTGIARFSDDDKKLTYAEQRDINNYLKNMWGII